MEHIASMTSIVSDLTAVFAVFLGLLATVFIFFQLAPVLRLELSATWLEPHRRRLLVVAHVANGSRVRVERPRVRLQVLDHALLPDAGFSEWVPFSKDRIRPAETPIRWREPVDIATTTRRLFPGESITLERLFPVDEDADLVHLGLQAARTLNWWERLVTGKKDPQWSQTITRIIVRPRDSEPKHSQDARGGVS